MRTATSSCQKASGNASRAAAGEPRGSGWLEAVHPDDREEAGRQWTQSVERQTLHDFTFRMRRHDGVYRMVRAYAAPLYDENNRLQEWFGTTTDVTGQYEAKAAIEERQLAAVGGHGCREHDDSVPRPPDWSLSWEGCLGSTNLCESRTLSYEAALNYVHAEDRAGLDTFLTHLSSGQETTFNLNFAFCSTTASAGCMVAPCFTAPSSIPLRIIGSLIDITDRKRMELMLREPTAVKTSFSRCWRTSCAIHSLHCAPQSR